MKNIFSLVLILFGVVLLSGCSSNKGIQKINQKEIKSQESSAQKMFCIKETSGEKLEQETIILNDEWNIYRNYEFGFEVKYPSDWFMTIKSSDSNNQNLRDSFFFENGYRVHFSILPKGGFGYGIKEPRITYENFKGKESKMFWYDDNDYPTYIYLLNDFPEKWADNNHLELLNGKGSEEYNEILKEMYASFKFLN